MSNQTYKEKEDKRMELQQALEEYKKAAEADALDESDMMTELDDTMADAGFTGIQVVPV